MPALDLKDSLEKDLECWLVLPLEIRKLFDGAFLVASFPAFLAFFDEVFSAWSFWWL